MTKIGTCTVLLTAGLVASCPQPQPRRPRSDLHRMPPLIPRQLLFAGEGRARPAISPDGRRLAFLSPVRGVVNLWVQTVGKQYARPVTRRGPTGVFRGKLLRTRRWHRWPRLALVFAARMLYPEDGVAVPAEKTACGLPPSAGGPCLSGRGALTEPQR